MSKSYRTIHTSTSPVSTLILYCCASFSTPIWSYTSL